MYLLLLGEPTIVVTGLPGSGKSAVCNFFAGENSYKVDDPLHVTNQTSKFKIFFNAQPVTLIDTPGFCDINITTSHSYGEMVHVIILAREGVHAFAFVLDVTSRFSKTHVAALQDFQKFGEVAPYTFVIFTKAKQLADDEKGQQLIIAEILSDSECPEALKEFMQSINYRYMLLESVDPVTSDYLATGIHIKGSD